MIWMFILIALLGIAFLGRTLFWKLMVILIIFSLLGQFINSQIGVP